MANHPLHRVLRLVRRTACAPGDPDSDAHLLDRFTHGRDGEAFALLVRRHGPFVLRVCRRVLRDEHLAEDAFQATFLVLARKAASVRRGEALAGWLGRVAFRAALRARSQSLPHRAALSLPADVPGPEAAGVGPDVRALLDEEVGRLPEKYRALVALCYWEGKTYEEAAALLGRPPGTVAGWLARARQLLRRRLVVRGLAPAVTAAALAAAPTPSRAALPAGAASPRAVALMEGVIREMFLNKVRRAAILLLALAIAGTAVGVALRASPVVTPAPEEPTRPAAQAEPAPKPPEDPKKPTGSAPRVEMKLAATLEHGGGIAVVLFSPDGSHLFTAGSDANPPLVGGQSHNGRVKLWDLATGKEAKGPPTLRYGVQGAALSPDGRFLALSTNGYLLGPRGRPNLADPGELVVYDTTGKRAAVKFPGVSFDKRSLVFSPDGKTLAAGTSPQDRRGLELAPGGLIETWDVNAGKATASFKGHRGYVQAVAYSPDGTRLISASRYPTGSPPREVWKGELKLWDVASGKEQAALEGNTGQVWSVAFSPDGNLAASGDDDGVVRLWDVGQGKEVASLPGHKGAVYALAFSPDGKWLVSGAGDRNGERVPGELKVWDVATRKEMPALTGHGEPVVALAFDRGGTKLASADTGGVVKLWAVSAAGKP
jgi:RNA polymerase sigma factor (sigma-70 family)